MKKNIAVNLTGNSTDGSIASGYQFYSFGTASDNLSYAGANYKSGAGGGYLANAIAPFSWVPRGTYLGFSTGISAVSDSLVSFSLLTSGQYRFFGCAGTIRTELTKAGRDSLGSSAVEYLKRESSAPTTLSDFSAIDNFNLGIFAFPTMKGVNDVLSSAPAWTGASDMSDQDNADAVAIRRNIGESVVLRHPLPGKTQAFDYVDAGRSGATQIGGHLEFKSYRPKSNYSDLFFDQTSLSNEKVESVYLRDWPELMTATGARPGGDDLPTKGETYDAGRSKFKQRIWFPDLVPQDRGSILKNIRYGHQFNFERGLGISLSSAYGWDVNMGPSYTYSNYFRPDDQQIRTEKGGDPSVADSSSADWNGWSVRDPTEPKRLKPWDNIGMGMLRGMGAAFPGVGRLIASAISKDFWDGLTKTAETEAEEEKSSQRQAESTETDHVAWEWGMAENILPARDLTTDDWYPSAWANNAAVEKEIGNTFSYRLGDNKEVSVSEDQKVVLKSEWKGKNITESEEFVTSESRVITNNVFENEKIDFVRDNTTALMITDLQQSFVSITSSVGGVETEWKAFGFEIETKNLEVQIDEFAGALLVESEVNYTNTDTMVTGAAKHAVDAEVNTVKVKAQLLRNETIAVISSLQADMGAARTEQSAMASQIKTKLQELEAKLAQIEKTATDNESRVQSLSSAALKPKVRALFDGGASALSNGRN